MSDDYGTLVGEPHRVDQTIFYSAEGNRAGVYGNCVQACLASVLGMPLDAVPHLMTFADWPAALRMWLAGIGLVHRVESADEIPVADEPCIATGVSPRGRRLVHSVAVLGNGVVWDPHPSREGLVKVKSVWWFEPRSALSVPVGPTKEGKQ